MAKRKGKTAPAGKKKKQLKVAPPPVVVEPVEDDEEEEEEEEGDGGKGGGGEEGDEEAGGDEKEGDEAVEKDEGGGEALASLVLERRRGGLPAGDDAHVGDYTLAEASNDVSHKDLISSQRRVTVADMRRRHAGRGDGVLRRPPKGRRVRLRRERCRHVRR